MNHLTTERGKSKFNCFFSKVYDLFEHQKKRDPFIKKNCFVNYVRTLTYLFSHLFTYLFIYLFIYLFVYLSIYLFIHSFIYLFIYLINQLIN